MKLKVNTKIGKLFFSCVEYEHHKNKNNDISLEDGLTRLKDKNQLALEIQDLDDEY